MLFFINILFLGILYLLQSSIPNISAISVGLLFRMISIVILILSFHNNPNSKCH